jgi:hypothetical protein
MVTHGSVEADDASVRIADPMLLIDDLDRVELSVDCPRLTTRHQLHLPSVVLVKLQTVDRCGRWDDRG